MRTRRQTASRPIGCRPGAWARARTLAAGVLAAVLAPGCEHAFEPFAENNEVHFSMFGVLDVNADTQWIRVNPIRRNKLGGPEPFEGVVTLRHLGTGEVVQLKDSLVAFRDVAFDGVNYQHNFWTTVPIEPGATYRLTARKPNGDSATVLVKTPPEFSFTLRNNFYEGGGSFGQLVVQAEHVISVESVHTGGFMEDSMFMAEAHLQRRVASHRFAIEAGHFKGRQELRIAVARQDWPYHSDLSELAIARSGTPTANVQGGEGFVGGVAIRTIPYNRCQPPGPGTLGMGSVCAYTYGPGEARLEGRVIRQPCGAPDAFQDTRLVERFPDGSTAVRHFKTDANGVYRFEGIDPHTELTIEIRPWKPSIPVVQYPLRAAPVPIPRLSPGQRYRVPDIAVRGLCG